MFQGLVSSIKETILTDYNPGNLIGDKYEGATNVGQVQARTDVPGRILEIPVPRLTSMKQALCPRGHRALEKQLVVAIGGGGSDLATATGYNMN